MGWLLKWSSVGDVLLRSGVNKVLLLAGFYPDSQNLRSDGAKIRSIFESSKYFGTFFVFSYLSLYFSETFCTFAIVWQYMPD